MAKKEYKKLKNDAQIIFVNDKRLRSINISAVFNVGSKNENDKTAGISHLIEHLICQDKSLNKRLESIGTRIYGNTYKETTSYLLRVLKDDFNTAFDIFIKSLIKFKPDCDDIDKEKKIILEEIVSRQNDNLIVVDDLLERIMYPNSYISKETTGNLSSVKKITKEDIEDYYQKHYNPRNLMICLVGNISSDIKNRIIQIIQGYRNKTKLVPEMETKNNKIDKTQKNITIRKDKSELIEVAIGFKGFNFFDEKKYFLRLLSIILTASYDSRLFREIREKEGLVYYLESFCVEYNKSG